MGLVHREKEGENTIQKVATLQNRTDLSDNYDTIQPCNWI